MKTKITHGDISLKPDATLEGCICEIQNIIKFYEDNYNLSPNDFFGVYHIIDTDGALIQNDIYVKCESGYFIKGNLIYTDNIEASKKINENKREIIKKLACINQICDINYKVLFFSRNLEHDLHNKQICTKDEKIKLSDDFELEYQSDTTKFYEKIKISQFDIPSDYDKSWEYILNAINSLKIGNNYIYLLEEIKNYKNSF